MIFLKHLLVVIAILVGGAAATGFVAGIFNAALPEYADPLDALIKVAGLLATVVFAVMHIVKAVKRARAKKE